MFVKHLLCARPTLCSSSLWFFWTSHLPWNLKLFISKNVLWQGHLTEISATSQGKEAMDVLHAQARQSPWVEGPDWKPTPEWTKSILGRVWASIDKIIVTAVKWELKIEIMFSYRKEKKKRKRQARLGKIFAKQISD